MFREIEEAIIARFEAKELRPGRKMVIQKSDGRGGNAPTIDKVTAGIQQFPARKIAQEVWEFDVKVFVFIQFLNLRSEKDRRFGAYPIVLAAVSYLVGQTLGLDIRPITFVNGVNSTTQEEDDMGLINFTLEFGTKFQIRMLSEDETDDLMNLALQYFLQPPENSDVPNLEGTVDTSP